MGLVNPVGPGNLFLYVRTICGQAAGVKRFFFERANKCVGLHLPCKAAKHPASWLALKRELTSNQGMNHSPHSPFTTPFTTPMILPSPQQTFPTPGRRVAVRYVGAVALALAAAAMLYTPRGHAQATDPAAAASAPAAGASQPSAAAASPTPKYAARDLERAFSFMDKDNNGKVSRDEASNFRGVSKHFDEADTNKDNMLSREEFERAMNGPKPQ